MNIEKLQKLITSGGMALSEGLESRIMSNQMTYSDIGFMEKSLMSLKLVEIQNSMELLVPTFQEATMRIIDLENEGETEVDLQYVKNLLNDLTSLFVDFSELVGDIGLTEIVPVA